MFKCSGYAALVLAFVALGASTGLRAQPAVDEPEWVESQVPPPPAFDVKKLVIMDMPYSASLVYGVDPSAISISKSDSVVRYVMVATSTSGAKNAMYEGLRCATGEFKTYARYVADGPWKPVADPQWRSVFGNMPSKHALQFARAAACDGAAPVSTVGGVIARLKNPNFRTSN